MQTGGFHMRSLRALRIVGIGLAFAAILLTDGGPAVSQGQPLFQDDFSDPTSGWDTWENDWGQVRYENGEYSIQAKERAGHRWGYAPPSWVLRDFVLELDARHVDGPPGEYGVIFRYGGPRTADRQDWGDFYLVALTTEGEYAVFRVLGRQWTPLVDYRFSSAIERSPAWNRIRIEAIGPEMRVLVNGQELAVVRDEQLAQGRLILFVNAFTEQGGTHAHFDNVRVFAAERAQQPGCTVTLSPGQALQPAIDQASEGAVICLQVGQYPIGSLSITKGIALVGLGTDPEKVVFRGNRAEPVIVIQTEGKVLLENLTVREGSGAGPTERGGGVHIENSKDVTLRRVILTENVRFGLVALLSQVRIEESQVLKTRPATPGRDGQGLRLKGSKVQVVKSVIRENGAQGLATRDADDEPSIVTVEESTVEQNVFNGLSVFDGSKLTVRKSRIANNQPYQGQFGDGVFAGAFSELVLEENVIEGHRPQGQFARFGVFITDEVKAVLRGNTIRNNAWGVGVGSHANMRETIQAEFYNNTITRSDSCGLWIDEDEGIKILGSGNTITNNGQNICGATGKVPPGFSR
jgi:nitrous oxidase accessory protein NosD